MGLLNLYNPEKAKLEKEQKERLEQEKTNKRIALEKFQKDPDFQKYVVRVIEKNIAVLADITMIDVDDALEVKSHKATVIALKQIFSEITK